MIKLLRLADEALGVLLPLISIVPQRRPKKIQKILVAKLWGLGEAVLTLPFLKQLKVEYPDAQIHVLVTKRTKPLFDQTPLASKVLMLEDLKNILRLNTYDISFDLEPYLHASAFATRWMSKYCVGYDHGIRRYAYTVKTPYNDAQHVVLTNLDQLSKVTGKTYRPNKLEPIPFSPEAKNHIKQFITKNPTIGICASSAESAPGRRWAPEKFATVADQLIADHGASVLFVGGPQDVELNNHIISTMKHPATNTAGKTTIEQLFALIAQCTLFISNDTGPMHMSAAQGVPTIGLFGPNTPIRFGPYGQKNIAIYKPVLDRPCINVHRREVPDCTHHNHMSKITVKDVLSAARNML